MCGVATALWVLALALMGTAVAGEDRSSMASSTALSNVSSLKSETGALEPLKLTRADTVVEEMWSIANLGQPVTADRMAGLPNLSAFVGRHKYKAQFAVADNPAKMTAAYLQLMVRKLSGKLTELNEVRLQLLHKAIRYPDYYENGYALNSRLNLLACQIVSYNPMKINEFPGYFLGLMYLLYPSVGQQVMFRLVLESLQTTSAQMRALRMLICLAADPYELSIRQARQALGMEYCEDETSIAAEVWRTNSAGAQFHFRAGVESRKFAARQRTEDVRQLVPAYLRRPISRGARARIVYLVATMAVAPGLLKGNQLEPSAVLHAAYNALLGCGDGQLRTNFLLLRFNLLRAAAAAAAVGGAHFRFLADAFVWLQADEPTADELALRRAQFLCLCAAKSPLDDTQRAVVDAVIDLLGAASCEIEDEMVEWFWQFRFGVVPTAAEVDEVVERRLADRSLIASQPAHYYQLTLAALAGRMLTEQNQMRAIFMLMAVRYADQFVPGTAGRFLTDVHYRIKMARRAPWPHPTEPHSRAEVAKRLREIALNQSARDIVRPISRKYMIELEGVIGVHNTRNAAVWTAMDGVVRSVKARQPRSYRMRIARYFRRLSDSIEASVHRSFTKKLS